MQLSSCVQKQCCGEHLRNAYHQTWYTFTEDSEEPFTVLQHSSEDLKHSLSIAALSAAGQKVFKHHGKYMDACLTGEPFQRDEQSLNMTGDSGICFVYEC